MKEEKESRQREFYIYTMILTPTIILAFASVYIESLYVRLVVQAMLIFLQGVLLKGIIDNR